MILIQWYYLVSLDYLKTVIIFPNQKLEDIKKEMEMFLQLLFATKLPFYT